MPPVVPPSSTPLPTPPSRSDPANFADRGDAFLGALPDLQTDLNAQGSASYANALEALAGASAASASAAAASASASAASGSAATSASNAALAAEYAGAQPWVSGTTYPTGRAVWSPLDYRIYRRRAPGGAGTTDPSLDGTNWQLVAGADVVDGGAINGELAINSTGTGPTLKVSNAGTGPSLLVEDTASVDGSPFVVAANGEVGVGIVAPLAKLHVNSNTSGVADLTGSVRISNESFTAGTYAGVVFSTADTLNSFITGVRQAGFGGALSFAVNTGASSSSLSEAMRITQDGRVGIGNAAPAARLHLDSGAAGAGLIVAASFDTSSQIVMGIGQVTAGRPFIGTSVGSNALDLGTRAAVPLVLLTDSEERMRIDASGNVLVGTASNPAGNKLNILDPSSFGIGVYRGVDVVVNGAAGEAISMGALVGAAQTTAAQIVSVLTDANSGTLNFNTRSGGVLDERMRITATGDVGIGVASPAARLDVAVSGGGRYRLDTSNPAEIIGTTSNAAGTTFSTMINDALAHIYRVEGTERMRLSSAGNLGLGTSAPSQRLTVNPSILVESAAATAPGITLTQSATASWSMRNDASSANFSIVDNSSGTRLTIDGSGRVGIGVSSPSAKLTVNPDILVESATGVAPTLRLDQSGVASWSVQNQATTGSFVVRNNTTAENRMVVGPSVTTFVRPLVVESANNEYSLAAQAPSGNLRVIPYDNSTTGALAISYSAAYAGYAPFTIDASRVNFYTNGVERARVDSDGTFRYGGIEVGYRDIPRVTGGMERGKMFATGSNVAVGAAPAAGACYTIYNDSAFGIVLQESGTTLRLAGTNTTGNRSLAARGIATIWFNGTTEAIVSGPGVS